jgi:hypothetical protein
MKIATNALVVLLVVMMVTFAPLNIGATNNPQSGDKASKRFEKVFRRHDKNMEVQASVLGMSPDELRGELRQQPIQNIIKKHGFKDISAFQKALVGKLKDELKHRGWTDRKINDFVAKRLERLRRA